MRRFLSTAISLLTISALHASEEMPEEVSPSIETAFMDSPSIQLGSTAFDGIIDQFLRGDFSEALASVHERYENDEHCCQCNHCHREPPKEEEKPVFFGECHEEDNSFSEGLQELTAGSDTEIAKVVREFLTFIDNHQNMQHPFFRLLPFPRIFREYMAGFISEEVYESLKAKRQEFFKKQWIVRSDYKKGKLDDEAYCKMAFVLVLERQRQMLEMMGLNFENYVADHQEDYDSIIHCLSYAHNAHVLWGLYEGTIVVCNEVEQNVKNFLTQAFTQHAEFARAQKALLKKLVSTPLFPSHHE